MFHDKYLFSAGFWVFFFNAALFPHTALSSFSHGEVITLFSHHILRLQVQFQCLQLSGNGTYRNMSGFPLPKRPPNMAQIALCHLLLCTEGMSEMFCFLSFHVQPSCAGQVSQPLHGEIPAICLDAMGDRQKPLSDGCRVGNTLHMDKQTKQPTKQIFTATF